MDSMRKKNDKRLIEVSFVRAVEHFIVNLLVQQSHINTNKNNKNGTKLDGHGLSLRKSKTSKMNVISFVFQ